jgi:nicotinate-nucleotide adenylyltransferase
MTSSSLDNKPHKALGIFGGTFDPIHLGHITPLKQAASLAAISHVKLMPCFVSPLKSSPQVDARHRQQMLQLVCQDEPLFSVDDRELQSGQSCYTVDTLSGLRTELPNTPLCFFMGMDSLLSLPSWHRWQDLLKLCHIIVCRRAGYGQALPALIQQLLDSHHTGDKIDLQTELCGRIFIAETDKLAISATEIRHQLAKGNCPSHLLPKAVGAYIQQHKLYSTGIC